VPNAIQIDRNFQAPFDPSIHLQQVQMQQQHQQQNSSSPTNGGNNGVPM